MHSKVGVGSSKGAGSVVAYFPEKISLEPISTVTLP